jgi:hypothetical protein
MNQRIEQLVEQLSLAPHPQGGFLGEAFRSTSNVEPDDGRGERPALSAMYMLLLDGHPSRMHAVKADEVWHFCEGSPIEVFWATEGEHELHKATLGPTSPGTVPMVTIPGNCWRAARSSGDFSLVSCVLGPAFDLRDFSPLVIKPELAATLSANHPELENLL